MIFESRVTIETPLAISLRRATGVDLATHVHLPGTVLRGALAGAYLDGIGSAADVEFLGMFLGTRPVHFLDHRLNGAEPWPLSARVCKTYPSDHKVADGLVAQAAGKSPGESCPDCKSKRKPPRGFHRLTTIEDRTDYRTEEVTTRRAVHVQIDPKLLRSQTGQFHSSRVVAPGQVLWGRVLAEGEAERSLRALVGEGITLYAGRGRSRGQGRIRLSVTEGEGIAAEAIRERMEELNTQVAGSLSEFSSKLLFTCTLQSPAILLDQWLTSRLWVAVEDFGGDLKGYQLLAWFTRATEITGWNAAAGLPKTPVHGLAAGSCFLFGRDMAPVGREKELQRLADLFAVVEPNGIGERREEGFGEISICNAFHYRRMEAR
jgi:CRISPR-associated protein Csx10